jgi:outer membrane protein insertion porin family
VNSAKFLLSMALIVTVLLPLALPALGQAVPLIADIRVEGNEQMSDNAVLSHVRLRAGQPYDDGLVQADVQRLLQTRRFERVTTERLTESGGVVLLFTVVERPLVKSLTVEGVREFKMSRIFRAIPFGQSDPLDRQHVEAGRERLMELYRERGFFDVSVTFDEDALRDNNVIFRVVEGPQCTVRGITFEGNDFFTAWKLRSTIGTKKRVWVFRRGYLDLEQLPRDEDGLRNLYVSEGFFDAEVGHVLDYSPDRTRVNVRFVVRQGPRFRVNELKFEGTTVFADRELAGRMELKTGKHFTSQKMQRSVRAVYDAYGEIGHIQAEVRPQRQFLPPDADLPDWASKLDGGKPALLNLVFTVSEGEQFRVGQIDIRGNSVTQDRVIRREIRVFPGQLFNTTALEESRRRLQELMIFEPQSVELVPQPLEGDGPGNNTRDLLVQVREGPTAQFVVGVGYSTNDGVLGHISFTQRNFDILKPGGWDSIMRGTAWKGAGQTFRIMAEPGTEIMRASVEWVNPYVGTSEYSWISRAYVFDRGRERYSERRAGMMHAIGRRFPNDWYAELASRLEGVDVYDGVHQPAPAPGRPARAEVPGRDDAQPVLEDGLGGDRRGLVPGDDRADGHVGQPVGDQDGLLVAGRDPGRDLHGPGVAAAERLHQRAGHELGEGGRRDGAQQFGRALGVPDRRVRLRAENHDRRGGAQQAGASGGQRHPALPAGDELVPEVLAEGGERLGDRGLADPERAGGRPDRPQARDQNESVQLRQRHRALQSGTSAHTVIHAIPRR